MLTRSLVSTLAGTLFVLACGGGAVDHQTAQDTAAPPSAVASLTSVEGRLRSQTHIFEELVSGVYLATGTGTVEVMSNALVVGNEHDVLVVDSHVTPDAARGLLDSIRALTEKPVRYLVNSHYHFDHAHGNQVFPDGIEIIGHEFTRNKLLGDVLNETTYRTIGAPERVSQQIAAMTERLARTTAERERTALEAQLAMQKRHLGALGETRPTPPNLTLTDKLTLFRGGREIQILHLGRGHTGGDLIVFLPGERLAFTGDLFYGGAQYLGDGYIEELIVTLDALKGLEAEILVGGHGPPVRDPGVIEHSQRYLRTYFAQVSGFHRQGLSVDEAITRLDLGGFEQWAGFQLGNPAVLRLEVARMYELLEQG